MPPLIKADEHCRCSSMSSLYIAGSSVNHHSFATLSSFHTCENLQCLVCHSSSSTPSPCSLQDALPTGSPRRQTKYLELQHNAQRHLSKEQERRRLKKKEDAKTLCRNYINVGCFGFFLKDCYFPPPIGYLSRKSWRSGEFMGA